MILENPFHRLGLLADVDSVGFTKRISRINALLAAEMPLEFQPDLFFAGGMRNSTTIEAAKRDLQTALGKIQSGVFWFTGSGLVDDMAFDELRSGNIFKALDYWDKVCNRPDISKNQISSLNNLGTLQLLLALANPQKNLSLQARREHFLNGLESKILLFTKPNKETQRFFFESIGDSIIAKQPDKIKDAFKERFSGLFEAADEQNLGLSVSDWSARIAGLGNFASELLAPFQNDIRVKIDAFIKEAKSDIAKGGMRSYQAAKRLSLEAPELLSAYSNIAGGEDLYIESLADKVAEAILDGGVKYFNGLDEAELKEVTRVLELTEAANRIAKGQRIKERLKENLDVLRRRQETERKEGQIKVESNAMHRALQKTVDASSNRASKNVIAELTPEEPSPWGVVDALVKLRSKGISTQGVSFVQSDHFINASDTAASVLLSKVIAEVNDVQENLEVKKQLGILNLDEVLTTFQYAEKACRLIRSTFVAKGSASINDKTFAVESRTRNRILENHETIKSLTTAAHSAKKGRQTTGAGCAVVFWILGGAALLSLLSSCF